MSILRRRVIATALAATATLALSACGTNFSAQTNQQYQAAEGANQRGAVDSMNTVLVADDDGAGVVSAALVNKTDSEQKLTGVTITTDDGTSLTVDGPTGLTIASGKALTLGATEDSAITVSKGATAGRYVTITFSFSDADDTEVDAPTVVRSETYESVVEAP